MGYVEKNLLPNEEIVYKAKMHWSIYLSGFISILIGSAIIGVVFLMKDNINILELHNALSLKITDFIVKYWVMPYIIGGIFIFAGIVNLIKAFILKISTELVITTKRVIAKFGFIKRNTTELSHNKVESFIVNQGTWQRIFFLSRICCVICFLMKTWKFFQFIIYIMQSTINKIFNRCLNTTTTTKIRRSHFNFIQCV